MNSYERVMARLAGQPVDRLPNLCILMEFAARHAGITFREFCLDSTAMARANLLCQRDFAIDAVTVMSDPYGEAMDYGMEVEFVGNEAPRVLAHFWPEDVIPDAESFTVGPVRPGGRLQSRLGALRAYAGKVKGQCPIIGWVEGSVAEYCDLRGTTQAMLDFATQEDFLPPILEKLCRQAILYIEAQVEAGADIIGIGDAACSLLGPALYRKYGLPYERRLIEAIHAAGAKAKLHICGNTGPILEDIAGLRPDIFDADWMVNLPAAAQEMAPGSVSGNFDPVAILLRGTPQDVAREVQRCAAEGGPRGIVSAGCEVPPDTAPQNLLQVARTLETLAP